MPDPFFRIEMLPAAHGDALLIEYGTSDTRRILIDGGPLHTFDQLQARLKRLPERGIELLVVTHVDTDHIEGAIRLLAPEASRWLVKPREVWFNGWRHLVEQETLGGREGEFMGALLAIRAPSLWNKEFSGKAVRVNGDKPPQVKLRDGMVLTLLSPDAKKLEKLTKDWRKSCTDWKLTPGQIKKALAQLAAEKKFHPGEALTLGPDDLASELLAQLAKKDASAANGSSIAFLAEFEGKSCLFLADAHMDVVCTSLERLGHSPKRPLQVDAIKMSHHGSRANLTKRFLTLVDAEHYLISTNGAIHNHPDVPAIEAVIAGSRRTPTLWFNYRVDTTNDWEVRSILPNATFRTRYPVHGMAGIIIEL